MRSDCRRLGVGSILLGFVDDVAKHLATAEVGGVSDFVMLSLPQTAEIRPSWELGRG